MKHGDVALRDVITVHGGGGLMVGLDDLRGLFKPFYGVYDSIL